VDRVDGRPVRVRTLLAGASGRALDDRLRALSAASARPPLDAARARRRAGAILAERRFRSAPYPRPLRGLLLRLGEPLERAARWLIESAPGGVVSAWSLVAAAAVLAAFGVATRLTRRRERRGAGPASSAHGPRLDPARLESEADAAERAGDPARAIRLRFRAGLMRLDQAGAIRLRPSLTSADVARRLNSPRFEELARDFDAAAYGGRMPEDSQVETSRTGWPLVLREARP
jgi:hypothetical protein